MNRDQQGKEIATERMKTFKNELSHWQEYDFVVINDKLENCYNKIKTYLNIKKENLKFLGYDKEIIKKHIENLLN